MKLRNKRTRGLANCEPIEVKTDAGFHDYYSLAELNEEWEDYCPKEPLIKDEKIRKAIRAWSEASDVGVARVAPFAVFDIETSARIFFYSRVIEDKYYDEEKTYTITELCGEEEEC